MRNIVFIIFFLCYATHTTYADISTYKNALEYSICTITALIPHHQIKKIVAPVYQVIKKKELERRLSMAFCLLYLGIDDATKKSIFMQRILPLSLSVLEVGCFIYEQLFLPIPPILKNLNNIELLVIPVLYQKEGSCGWHATINARGIQQAVEQGLFDQEIYESSVKKIINNVHDQWFLHIRNNAQSIMHAMEIPRIFDELRGDEQDKLAHIIGLKNYYVMYIKEGEANYYTKDTFQGYKSANNYYKIETLDSFFDLIQSNPAPIKHILLGCPSSYDNNHGITLSIITCNNKKPLLIYTDSNNTPLIELGPDSINTYFVVKFILALDKAYGQ